MFGSKSKEIARLALEVQSAKSNAQYWENCNNSEKSNSEYWIKLFTEINDRYTLLDSLLKQLRVNVTLPAKKTARQN